MKHNIEILAPAGSVEGMRAAFSAGADAVYIGGRSFGARAFAQNADQRALLDAIDEAHLHGKKLYLTVNTLLKNRELSGELVDYLRPYYEQGLDAVLVQDYGVMKVIRENFPEMPVHASTQMTVCGPDYGLWLKEWNVRRLVLPRELSIDEIREMKRSTGLEIEVFVHGALCYCYSGQCLMSSMIGGRSGNRGRCAQPCRLTYTFKEGRELQNGHLLSLKDLCGLESLPDLIEAGVDSLKIEGRMKKPEYAALTSRVYRHYADIYFEKGAQAFSVRQQDLKDLMDLYSRGGFTKGYYHMHNGAEMITPDRPNHSGTKAGEIIRDRNGNLGVRLCEDAGAGDVLELPDGNELTVSSAKKSGGVIPLPGKKHPFKAGDKVLRTKNAALTESLSEKYVRKPELKEKIYGFVSLSKDSDAKMDLYDGDHAVSVSGARVSEASNRPLSEENVRRQMEKTGGTPFVFEKLEIDMEDDLFLPVSELNALRRKAFDALSDSICGSFRRHMPVEANESPCAADDMPGGNDQARLHVLVTSTEQLQVCLENSAVERIYVEIGDDPGFLKDATTAVHRSGKKFWPALPHIWRRRAETALDQMRDLIAGLAADGFLVRNMESLFWLKKNGFTRPCISDSGIYTMNDSAFGVVRELFEESTMPVELNRHELSGMAGLPSSEVIVYGKIPLMFSAQCLLKTCGSCTGISGIHPMKDRMNKTLNVRNFCKWCYNLIDNPVPLFIPEVLSGDLGGRVPSSVRLQFTDEDAVQTKHILEVFASGDDFRPSEYTKGHYKRGVE